jgi:putative transposase
MDRGFAGLKFLQKASHSNKYFVLRIPNNYKLQFHESEGLFRVGTGKESGIYRVVNFCDLSTQVEYRLVTNLTQTGEQAVTDEEIRKIYRCRWGIEMLWNFLNYAPKTGQADY